MTELEIFETIRGYLKKEHLSQQEMAWLLKHKAQMLEVVQQGFVVATDHILEPVSDKAKENWMQLEQLLEKQGAEMKVREEKQAQKTILIHWWRYAAAAAIIFIAFAGYFVWNNSKSVESMVFKRDFNRQPGSNQATIQLADGRILQLDSLGVGELAQEGNAFIAKNSLGEVEYQLTAGSVSKGGLQYNTMSTPMGGQYRLKLNDGTVVWLNAGSSITYPVVFAENERRVKVKGELFFEIAQKKNQPFIVDVDAMEVQVLGTAFNVSSYDNEEEVSTTLLEGAVKVINHQNIGTNHNNEVKLRPGQQALINKKVPEQLKITEVNDLQQVVAWKNGLFNFDGSDLKTVMRQLERWYNIEVRYTREVEHVKFTGKLHRNTNLADVLNVLELMDVKFKMEGNILYVK